MEIKYYSICPILGLFRKSNSLREHHLMDCLLRKKIQVSKTNLLDLNFNERGGIEFLNKGPKCVLGNYLFDFSKRTLFWDIPKWNRRLTIWDAGVIT